ncbi:MAG: DUF4252 domain-containing protein [Thermoanaerobaculia bacterium]
MGEQLAELPGYVPLEQLEVLAPEDVSIEVNPTAPMLKRSRRSRARTSPELAALVQGLQAVRVRSGEPAAGDMESVRERVRAAGRWLDERGWAPMVRVRDEGDDVLIYTRLDDDGTVQGITVLALEDDEATVVNLIGRLDPEQLGRIVGALDLPLGDLGSFDHEEHEEEDR